MSQSFFTKLFSNIAQVVSYLNPLNWFSSPKPKGQKPVPRSFDPEQDDARRAEEYWGKDVMTPSQADQRIKKSAKMQEAAAKAEANKQVPERRKVKSVTEVARTHADEIKRSRIGGHGKKGRCKE